MRPTIDPPDDAPELGDGGARCAQISERPVVPAREAARSSVPGKPLLRPQKECSPACQPKTTFPCYDTQQITTVKPGKSLVSPTSRIRGVGWPWYGMVWYGKGSVFNF